jgi:hypothetical protein
MIAGSLLLVFLIQFSVETVHSFAVSSSQSPKRKQVTNQGKAAGGFGKSTDSVPATHTRDESTSTQNLLNFLKQWKSEGLGTAGTGTEVGFDTTNGSRGLYATKAFKKNDILCKIPSDVALALTDPSTATDETMNVADGGVNFLEWYANNAQARQMWTAYLDTLPTREAYFDVRTALFCCFIICVTESKSYGHILCSNLQPTPDFYSDTEIEELELPVIVKAATERKNQISDLSQSKVRTLNTKFIYLVL